MSPASHRSIWSLAALAGVTTFVTVLAASRGPSQREHPHGLRPAGQPVGERRSGPMSARVNPAFSLPETIPELRAWVVNNPDEHWGWFTLGVRELDAGNAEAADAWRGLEAALARATPGPPGPEYFAGWARRGLGDEQGAREHWVRAVGQQRAIVDTNATPRALYDLGCFHALLGEFDAAFEWLQKAADSGWDRARTMEADVDLVALRNDPRYPPLLEKVRARANRPVNP